MRSYIIRYNAKVNHFSELRKSFVCIQTLIDRKQTTCEHIFYIFATNNQYYL